METAWHLKSLTKKILDRHDQLVDIREPRNERMEEIIEFVQPGLTGGFTGKNTEDEFRGQKIYEGTPPWALRVMTDGWLGSLISETLQWLKYMFPEKLLRENDEVNEWVQNLEDAMYGVYRGSELYPALAPFTRSALSVGSPVIIPYEEKTGGKIKCEVPHPKENYHGPYDSYHRDYPIDALQAVRKFMKGQSPDADSEITDQKLSRALLSDYVNGLHAKRHKFIRAIYHSDDPILDDAPAEFKSRPWMEFYVEKEADDAQHDKPPILVQGYWTKPHIVWHYEINTDERYARTPAWNAMMDIRSGQQMAKDRLEYGQRALNPPMWAQRKYKGHLHMQPRGFTYYGTAQERLNKPEPIIERVDYQAGVDVHDSYMNTVKRWFQTDYFQQLTQMSRDNRGSWPTATQIMALDAEKAVVLGPRIGRFTNVLREIDTRFFDMTDRAGKLPPPPDIVLEYMALRQRLFGDEELDLDVEFMGPLAQAQQRGLTLGRSEAGLSIIERYTAIDAHIPSKVILSVQMETDLEAVGWSQKAIVPEDQYQEGLREAAEREAQQAALEQAAAVADAIPKISGTVEPDSALAALAEVA